MNKADKDKMKSPLDIPKIREIMEISANIQNFLILYFCPTISEAQLNE